MANGEIVENEVYCKCEKLLKWEILQIMAKWWTSYKNSEKGGFKNTWLSTSEILFKGTFLGFDVDVSTCSNVLVCKQTKPRTPLEIHCEFFDAHW